MIETFASGHFPRAGRLAAYAESPLVRSGETVLSQERKEQPLPS